MAQRTASQQQSRLSDSRTARDKNVQAAQDCALGDTIVIRDEATTACLRRKFMFRKIPLDGCSKLAYSMYHCALSP